MTLTEKAAYTVILPQDPTPREVFAAEEIAGYMTRILGKSPTEGGDVRFVIGGPGRNFAAKELISKEEFDALVTGPEGYLIRVSEDAILLAGSEVGGDDERGTLYAAYDFLEKYCGCTLAAYTAPGVDAGEIVPRAAALCLPLGDRVKASADRPFRAACVQYGDRAGNPHRRLNVAFFDWLAKNRYNRIYLWASSYVGYCEDGLIPELEKRGIRLMVGHHESLWLWLPYYGNPFFSEHYIETHPEYYRLEQSGERFKPKEPNDPFGQWIICSRNEEAIEAVSRNMITWLLANPLVDIVTLGQNDGHADQCCCPMCAPYSKTENYIYFVNEVARRVRAEVPYAKIQMAVYVDIWKCPEGTRLEPNITVTVATWSKILRSAGKPDGSCLNGTDYEDTIVGWRKMTGASAHYYDYYMGVYSNRQRVIPMADELQAIWKNHMKIGVDGAITQIEAFNLWNHLLNFYSFARTGYDTSLSLRDNVTSLCRLFGDGGAKVGEIMYYLEAEQDGQENVLYAGRYLIENIDLDYVYRLFDEALAVTSGARERNNLRLLRMAFRFSHLEATDKINAERRPWPYIAFREYDDPTGELAYIATNYESFFRNDPGYGIACPATNTDTKDFVPGIWYAFEGA